ncbi:MAG: PDZ domain-containing protein, partial [Clostridia bacterium]|nr:PDZ domain-containing protein [Clostridia bacterium]
ILKVNETDITSCEELASIIAESAPGDIVRIHLYRQGSILEFDVSPIS